MKKGHRDETEPPRFPSYEALLTEWGEPMSESPYALVVFLEICSLLKADWRVVQPDETMGRYIRFPAWLMTLDDILSPVEDLVVYLLSHETVADSLTNLNEIRDMTFRGAVALILQSDRSPEKTNDRRLR